MRTTSALDHPDSNTRLPASSSNGDSFPIWKSTWALATFGNVLFWAALPPLSIGLLAWLAPVPWVILIRRPIVCGRRPYLTLWLSAFVFWLATLYWLTLPHWATSIGWIALSFYLALYFAAFIGLSRVAVHRLQISPILAAPIVWTGLELCRAHFLSGFAMASLAHTQVGYPMLLQVSDIFGGYGVGFAMLFVGAAVARMFPCAPARRTWWPIAPAVAILIAIVCYGQWRLSQVVDEPGPKVALIQGSIDIEMKHDPTQAQRIQDEYVRITHQAVENHSEIDLIVWPETMFRYPWFTFDERFEPPDDAGWTVEQAEESSRRAVANTVVPFHKPFLLGIETVFEAPGGIERFNSALCTDGQGHVLGRYDKCHLVAFGEYVPFARALPWLYNLTPLPGGLASGTAPRTFEIGNAQYSPNICYEDTVPHFIRSQVLELRREDREPDLLINLTNDGWFWGSSELDMHLACAVLRAIECRKPFLIAANTGFSAWIDSNGQIRAQGPRRATGVIVANTVIDHRGSWYLDHGDLPAGVCLLSCIFLAIVGWKRSARTPNSDGKGG